ncbi:MAG: STAS domain-containing protein [Acidobacteriaceae bacterium]|nr:STAS domain-containing protein [Acidobacteriaceae bacterium]
MLQIETKYAPPDVVILELSGKLTLGRDCKQLEWTTENLVRENQKKVILDLRGVTHIDSTGIGIIMSSAAQVKGAGGELRLSGATGHVEEVLKITSVDKVVPLHATSAAAAAGF